VRPRGPRTTPAQAYTALPKATPPSIEPTEHFCIAPCGKPWSVASSTRRKVLNLLASRDAYADNGFHTQTGRGMTSWEVGRGSFLTKSVDGKPRQRHLRRDEVLRTYPDEFGDGDVGVRCASCGLARDHFA
jgi:hypothetical protein